MSLSLRQRVWRQTLDLPAVLPFPLVYGLAWLVYLLAYRLAGYRSSVVRENLARAFPERNAKELTVLMRRFYRQLAEVLLETAKARRMTPAQFAARVQVRNPELLRAESEDFSRSVLVVTLHQGNWEWMLHGCTLALGRPLDPIYQPLHEPIADHFMHTLRSRFGARPLPLANAARDLLRHRRTPRLVAVVADQAPGAGERGYRTDFLHQQTVFATGPETLARLLDCPMVFARCERLRRGHYAVEFTPLARPPWDSTDSGARKAGDHKATRRFAQLAEQSILREPESWLWSHRRWRERG